MTRTAVGEYMVTWDMQVAGCSYTVSPGYYNGGNPDKYAIAQVYQGTAGDNVIVKTYEVNKPGPAAVTAKDYAWHGQLACNDATETSS